MSISRGHVFALAILLAAFSLYYPGSEGPFLLDDYYVLVNNPAFSDDLLSQNGPAASAHSFHQGSRAFSMFTFGLNYLFAAEQVAYSIKLTNILLHLFVAVLLYILTWRLYPMLLGRWQGRAPNALELQAVALLTMSLWLLHPLHVSTVLYAVQRMAILSALFTCMGMLLYLEGRQQLEKARPMGWFWIASSLCLAGGAALLSKENGALLVFFLLLIELATRRFSSIAAWPQFSPLMLRVVLLLPSLLLAVLILRYLLMPESYSTRDFTAVERLLTQGRVLMFYLSELIYPAVDRMGLFWGTEEVSRGVLSPPSTLPSLAAILVMLGLAVWGVWRRQYLLPAFGMLWFFAGHAMESTVVPLEMVFEHRNYLVSYGLALIVAWLLVRLAERVPGRLVCKGPLLLLPPLLLAYALEQRVEQWRSAEAFYQHELQREPRSLRLWESYGLYLERSGRHREALLAYHDAAAEYPQEATFILAQWHMLRVLGVPVPSALRMTAEKQLSELPIGKGVMRGMLRLLYGCGASESRELEGMFHAIEKNRHWKGQLWQELMIVAISDYHARNDHTGQAEAWLQKLPSATSIATLRKHLAGAEEEFSYQRCPPDENSPRSTVVTIPVMGRKAED